MYIILYNVFDNQVWTFEHNSIKKEGNITL